MCVIADSVECIGLTVLSVFFGLTTVGNRRFRFRFREFLPQGTGPRTIHAKSLLVLLPSAGGFFSVGTGF